MNRQELWGRVYVAHVLYRNCEEAASIADLSVAEWDKRFGAVPLPKRSAVESPVRKEKL